MRNPYRVLDLVGRCILDGVRPLSEGEGEGGLFVEGRKLEQYSKQMRGERDRGALVHVEIVLESGDEPIEG